MWTWEEKFEKKDLKRKKEKKKRALRAESHATHEEEEACELGFKAGGVRCVVGFFAGPLRAEGLRNNKKNVHAQARSAERKQNKQTSIYYNKNIHTRLEP